MTTEQSSMAASMVDSFGRVTSTTKALFNSIATALAPTITDIANRIAGITSTVIKWVQQNQSLILSIGKGIGIATALGTGLIALGSTISIVGMGVAGLGTALSAIGAIAGAVLSPVGILVAGISAGAYAFLTMTDAGRSLVDFFVGEFQSLYAIVKPVLDSIIGAFRSGDLQLAASIAFAAIKIPALSAWSYIKGVFDEGVFYVGSLWDGMVFGLMKAWTVVRSGLTWDFLKIGLLSVGKFLSDTFLGIVSGIADMFGWMVKKVAGALYALNIISDKTLVGVNGTIRDISKSISGLRDGNNSFYDGKIAETKTDIANSEGGKELAALEAGRQQSVRDRANAMFDSKSASEKAITDAQRELADLMKQQADLAANYKPAEPGQPKSAVQKAIEIQPQKIMSEMKTDVGSTASFNSRVASMLATNAKSKYEQESLSVLNRIADGVEELEGVGGLAGGED